MYDGRSIKCDINVSEDLIFQILSWNTLDYEYDIDGDDSDDKYLIKIFGVTEKGESVSLNVLNYTPYFYIKIHHKIDKYTSQVLTEFMVSKLPYNLKTSLIDVTLLKKKDFIGFSNNEKFTFARLKFKNIKAYKSAIRIFQKKVEISTFSNELIKYRLYESNIDPFLRMMHIRNIEPCGWIKLDKDKYNININNQLSHCQIDIECKWTNIVRCDKEKIAPLIIASFDLECTSSHGDFPVAKKSYAKTAYEILQYYNNHKDDYDIKNTIYTEIIKIFKKDDIGLFSKVYTKVVLDKLDNLEKQLKYIMDDIIAILACKINYKKVDEDEKEKVGSAKDIILEKIIELLGYYRDDPEDIKHKLLGRWTGIFPELEGDKIIQIGTTTHIYGEKECNYKNIITLGTCELIDNVEVQSCSTERELLLKWRDLIIKLDPDIITGYNILGFDMSYLYERTKQLGITKEFCKIGRFRDHCSEYEEKALSSSALGDNLLKYIDMEGRVIIDIMKVVQRDHKLDSYRLDAVATHFMKMNKNDIHPNDIFRLQKGNAEDRKIIANYCVQDCTLCNHLMMKLEIIANNIGMSNVCYVPLSYIFMRGQSIKIFSLVAKECREADFVIPTLNCYIKDNDDILIEDEDGYEGAIVLPPKAGIYIDDPVAVLDYASLYPSSMISENLSHDSIVLNQKYNNLPGYKYLDITYDVFEKVNDKKVKTGDKTVRFAQFPDNEKGTIPKILMKLLAQRKDTRKKIEFKTVIMKSGEEYKGSYKEKDKEKENIIIITKLDGTFSELNKDDIMSIDNTYNDFQKAVLDGLQSAYKITANSLYGQCGAKTSAIFMKEIAACTTATGRKMILMAKKFLEENYFAEIIYGDSVTGDTPLIIRYNDKTIDIVTIDSFTNVWSDYNQFKSNNNDLYDKEQSFIEAEIWTDNKWSKIKRVIRHKCNKKIYRINTFKGCVDVTEDHSLIDINGKEIKPVNCIKNETKIMHSFPDVFEINSYIITKEDAFILGIFFGDGDLTIDNLNLFEKYIELFYESNYKCKKVPKIILNASYEIRKWFLDGYLSTDKCKKQILYDGISFECKGKIGAQGLYYIAKSIGWINLRVNIQDYKENIYWISNIKNNNYYEKNKDKVKKVIDLVEINGERNIEEYVYDIETEQGRFHGGVGEIILKNTDSLFIIFPNKDEEGKHLHGKQAIMPSIKTAQAASKEFNKLLKKPHDLEYEKTLYPFILFSKKRYAANKYEFNDINYKMISTGIVTKRRDNANIVKIIFGGILDIILNEHDIKKSIQFLKDTLNKLIIGEILIEDLIVTKNLRGNYKDPTRIAHKVLADRMKERDPGNCPSINDRVPYAYIQVEEKRGEKLLQGNRIEHPDYIRKNKLKLDYEFYITNQIMTPILQLYALVLEDLDGFRKVNEYKNLYASLLKDKEGDEKKAKDRLSDLRENEVKQLLFDPILIKIKNKRLGYREISEFFKVK